VCHGVADGVELAPLPGDSLEGGGASCLESGMIVADDELHASHASGEKALKGGSPVVLRLAELDAAAEDGSLAIRRDADGREDGTGDDGPAVADLLVPGIEDEVGDLADRPVPPGGQRC
jgi:hypothetical protein